MEQALDSLHLLDLSIQENFSDFIAKYGIQDMYSADFYHYDTLEEYWLFWSRHIYLNRYQDTPKSVYTDLSAVSRDMEKAATPGNVAAGTTRYFIVLQLR
ncbi:hypothetical protein [Lachnoclostridium sp. An181]|uniref:hypothetical protein n=1 Tax=Lachnoclostridium sp. An181 TaxID=1965575 RepID=UPI000B3A9ABA|nr:hypothetical protein [Lachnoclostridium sp. An181]OUP50885.1 hypothetical protein B5F18_01570 [Lachnoclostridium sp. An181]